MCTRRAPRAAVSVWRWRPSAVRSGAPGIAPERPGLAQDFLGLAPMRVEGTELVTAFLSSRLGEARPHAISASWSFAFAGESNRPDGADSANSRSWPASCMLSRFWSSAIRTGLACPRVLPPVGALRTSSGAFIVEIRRLRHFGRFEHLVGQKPTRPHRSEGRARPAQYSSAVMPSRTTSWYVPAKNSCWRRRPSSTKPSLR